MILPIAFRTRLFRIGFLGTIAFRLSNRQLLMRLSLSIYSRSYMVDAADHDRIEAARNELHNLLDKVHLAGIPVLVLGNKRDLPDALDEKELIEQM